MAMDLDRHCGLSGPNLDSLFLSNIILMVTQEQESVQATTYI